MNLKKVSVFLLFALFYCLSFEVSAQKQRIHSHNDYLRKEPFYEAFKAGCASIEADIFLKEGNLYVAHEEKSIRPNLTFATLYLEPLLKINRQKRFKNSNIQLLIDLKTAAGPTLKALVAEIENYPQLFEKRKSRMKISFVISGNRPKPSEYKDFPAYIKFDCQELESLDQLDKDRVALVSFSFQKFSKWYGSGTLSEEDRSKISAVVSKVHSLNKRIRFWGTPDTEKAWQIFSELGIDYINTDKPSACGAYFKVEPIKLEN